MDGNTIDMDPKTAEAMRQQKVYEAAMASLARKKQRSEGESLALMFAADEFGEMVKPGTRLGRVADYSKFLLVLLLGIFVNYLFWAHALN